MTSSSAFSHFPFHHLRASFSLFSLFFLAVAAIAELLDQLRRRTMLLQWLITFFLLSSHAAGDWDGVVIGEDDYQGLLAFKQSLSDPRGFLRSWNSSGSTNACSGAWAGIKCVKGSVIAIQLPYRGLGGQITPNIGQLSALRKLSLHDNLIGGQIPSGVGFLAQLRGLYLFNNRFSGEIPPSLGNCPMLQTLDVSGNLLTGSIPTSIANSTKLYRLNLGFNGLSGEIPASVSGAPALAFVSLRHNDLSGPIPDSWEGGNQLQSLNLDHNSLSGNIPSSIGRLKMLQEITLDGNKLNGSIPDALGTLSSLRRLYLSNNSIGGVIPPSIGNITSLSELDLSDNELTGGIPTSLDRLINLTFFNVSDNKLSGPVPPFLATRFNASSFRGNIQLCGFSHSVPCPSPPPNIPISPSPPPSSLSPTHRHHRRMSTRNIILIAVGIFLVLLLQLCCLLLFCFIRKRTTSGSKATASSGGASTERGAKPGSSSGVPEAAESTGDKGGKLAHFDGPMAFTADDLLCATAEIMGKSTYGTVYKATLEDGNQVAVKRLREKIAKGQKEFESEVNALGKIRHPNLLALRAYYLGPKAEKLLVFDYMPKGNLAAFLHAQGPETQIDWPTRMKIAMGVARGLRYLHTEMNMVHGNLTSSNILMDEDANPRISDYGLSRMMTAASSTNVIATSGALGYRAPELLKLKKATAKTDVYSLGVVILELLTGKSPGEAANGVDLPQWVASIVKEEWTNEVFDLELVRDAASASGSGAGDELLNTLKLALHCVDPSPGERPEANQVLRQLEEIRPELAVPATEESGTAAAVGGAEG